MPTLASRDADVRITALVVVVLLHAALIAWIATARRQVPVPEAREEHGVLLFLPDRAASSSQGPQPAPREPRILPAPVRPPAPLPITPPTESPQGAQPTPPPAIDWHEQAAAAAARQIEGMTQPSAGPGASPSQPANPTQPKPEFGWNHARTHRVEAIEGGGILVWINDRCAIVITLLAMPICKIGKIPARGDLFDHMGDTTAGDWKEN